jgi:uncharacterized surface protein with fasciclin (FAS1) repeats
MQNLRPRRTLTLVSGLAAVVLVATSCGTSSSQASDTSTPSVPSTARPDVVPTDPATSPLVVPTSVAAAAAPAATDPAAPPLVDVVATAAGLDDFSTLVAALSAAGLAPALQGAGPFTVFAPTNEAFAKLPPGLVDALLLPENKAVLSRLLAYHVVGGEVRAAALVAGPVATLAGRDVVVSLDGGVKVGAATVVTADVLATNGVIHAIDAVLIPPDLDLRPFGGPAPTVTAPQSPPVTTPRVPRGTDPPAPQSTDPPAPKPTDPPAPKPTDPPAPQPTDVQPHTT